MNIDDLKRELSMLQLSGACSLEVNEQPILAEAYGYADLAARIENNTGTRFATASIAKGFTAVAMLQLIEQGEISLATRATTVLPAIFPSLSGEVTVKHLLTHTSGFADYCDEEQDVSYDSCWNSTLTEPSAYLPLLVDKQMEFPPGSRFKYNNGAFVLLSMIVENVACKPFSVHIHEHVLQPAGMTESGYFRMDQLPPKTAIGYTLGNDGQLKTNLYAIPVIGGGDGGIYTTLTDLGKFWRALAQNVLLKDSTIAEAWRPQVYSDDESLHYGLGFWLVSDGEEISNILLIGSDAGVACRSSYYPEQDAVISVLQNGNSSSRPPFKLLEKYLLTKI